MPSDTAFVGEGSGVNSDSGGASLVASSVASSVASLVGLSNREVSRDGEGSAGGGESFADSCTVIGLGIGEGSDTAGVFEAGSVTSGGSGDSGGGD